MQGGNLKKLAAGCCAGVILTGGTVAVQAAPVSLIYRFDNGTSFVNPALDPASLVPTELTGAGNAWSDLDGTLTDLNGQGSVGRAIAARSWHDGNAFVFSLNVASGFKLDLTEIGFFEQGSSGGQGLGPTQWKLSINGSDVTGLQAAFRGNPGAVRTISDSVLPDALTGVLSFEIFATGAENGTGVASNATWRIDNFTLTGDLTPVPVPAAAWLFGSALAGLATWRRRAA